MTYLYVGTVVDTLDFSGKEIILIPESQVEIPDEFSDYPYFQRLIQSGVLKAISPEVTK